MPPKVVEKDLRAKIWDFQIQTDKQVMANQTDIVVLEVKKMWEFILKC